MKVSSVIVIKHEWQISTSAPLTDASFGMRRPSHTFLCKEGASLLAPGGRTCSPCGWPEPVTGGHDTTSEEVKRVTGTDCAQDEVLSAAL